MHKNIVQYSTLPILIRVEFEKLGNCETKTRSMVLAFHWDFGQFELFLANLSALWQTLHWSMFCPLEQLFALSPLPSKTRSCTSTHEHTRTGGGAWSGSRSGAYHESAQSPRCSRAHRWAPNPHCAAREGWSGAENHEDVILQRAFLLTQKPKRPKERVKGLSGAADEQVTEEF